MVDQSYGYISVIATSFIETVVKLTEALESTDPKPPNEVKTTSRENGYSCGIIVMAALLLESALNRARHVRKEPVDRRTSVSDTFEKIVANPELAEQVQEIFTIRDVIVHNHLWTADVKWDESLDLVFSSKPVLEEGYGNERFRKVLDSGTRLSSQLQLNLFPSRIWRRDAYKVLEVVTEALMSLEGIDRNYFYLSPQEFAFKGRLMSLQKIVDSLTIGAE